MSSNSRISLGILSHLRPNDFLSLCQTSKALQTICEPLIYRKIADTSVVRIFLACRTLARNERLAEHVTQLFILRDDYPRLPTQQQQQQLQQLSAAIQTEFHGTLHAALKHTKNLVNLVISDRIPISSNFYRYSSINWKFQLHELVLQGPIWDYNTRELLSTQPALKMIKYHEAIEGSIYDDHNAILPGALPNLEIFDGGFKLSSCSLLPSKPPIRNLQIAIGPDEISEKSYFLYLDKLVYVATTLTSLSLLKIPEDFAFKTVDVIARCCPNLRHLGMIPWPMVKASIIYTLRLCPPKASQLKRFCAENGTHRLFDGTSLSQKSRARIAEVEPCSFVSGM